MPRELRALHQRQVLAGSGADPVHALSARTPADPAQTLASVATQGRCGGEEQQVAPLGGVVVGKGSLKRPGSVARGGGSGAAKKVSFASEPQVSFMSPPALVRALGRRRGRDALPGAQVDGGERLRPRRARFGGAYSVLSGAAAPLRWSMRNAANLGAGAEQVTVAVCDSAKFEEEGDVRETVDKKRKRKTRENSEHMVASAQIGVSPRSTRLSGLLSQAPFVSPPAVEKKRARRKGPDVKEQTLEEQPGKLENRRQPTKARSNSYQEPASSVEEEYQAPVVVLCKAPLLRRSSRNHSEASGLLLNSNTSSESNNCTRAREEGNEVKISCLSMHKATKDGTEEGMTKEDGHLELSSNDIAKDCAGTEEQMVDAVVRKGCLKRSGADVCSRSSGVPKKVTFKLMEQAAADVEGFRRRPWAVADGEGDAGEADSDAPLRWSRRNAANSGAADGVEKIAEAASRNISANAYEEEKDAGEVVDKKRKASENDIGDFNGASTLQAERMKRENGDAYIQSLCRTKLPERRAWVSKAYS